MQSGTSTAVSGQEALGERLAGVLAGALGDDRVRVRELRRLTGGASRETWAVEVDTSGSAPRSLILRRDPLAGDSAGGFATEAAVLKAAARAGVPEPAVLAYDDDPAALGAPYLLMDFVPGETLARRILRDDEFAAVRPRLAAQCGGILARIHAIAPAEVPAVEAVDPIELLRGLLDRFEDATPALELGLRWLVLNRPQQERGFVVHGDFRNGNLIVDRDGIAAVLDWELVHLGDPMEDLGYLCARVWRFGGPRPVGGFGDYDDLFAAYEAAGGRRVDPAVVRWWEVWSAVRWGIGCMQMSWEHLSGALRSVERAAIGRRTWEQEYDVMLELEAMGVS